jgi:hypothetical protein
LIHNKHHFATKFTTIRLGSISLKKNHTLLRLKYLHQAENRKAILLIAKKIKGKRSYNALQIRRDFKSTKAVHKFLSGKVNQPRNVYKRNNMSEVYNIYLLSLLYCCLN